MGPPCDGCEQTAVPLVVQPPLPLVPQKVPAPNSRSITVRFARRRSSRVLARQGGLAASSCTVLVQFWLASQYLWTLVRCDVVICCDRIDTTPYCLRWRSSGRAPHVMTCSFASKPSITRSPGSVPPCIFRLRLVCLNTHFPCFRTTYRK